jgi:hypothetical protein
LQHEELNVWSIRTTVSLTDCAAVTAAYSGDVSRTRHQPSTINAIATLLTSMRPSSPKRIISYIWDSKFRDDDLTLWSRRYEPQASHRQPNLSISTALVWSMQGLRSATATSERHPQAWVQPSNLDAPPGKGWHAAAATTACDDDPTANCGKLTPNTTTIELSRTLRAALLATSTADQKPVIQPLRDPDKTSVPPSAQNSPTDSVDRNTPIAPFTHRAISSVNTSAHWNAPKDTLSLADGNNDHLGTETKLSTAIHASKPLSVSAGSIPAPSALFSSPRDNTSHDDQLTCLLAHPSAVISNAQDTSAYPYDREVLSPQYNHNNDYSQPEKILKSVDCAPAARLLTYPDKLSTTS